MEYNIEPLKRQEKLRGKKMLDRIYQRILENVSKTANRLYPQRPHNIVPIKDWQPWGALIRINTKVLQALKVASTAPSACLRISKGKGDKALRSIQEKCSSLRKHFVNGNKMRMASVLKAGKYRKKL